MEQDFKHNNSVMQLYNLCARLAQVWGKHIKHVSLAMALGLYINKQKKLSQYPKE